MITKPNSSLPTQSNNRGVNQEIDFSRKTFCLPLNFRGSVEAEILLGKLYDFEWPILIFFFHKNETLSRRVEDKET